MAQKQHVDLHRKRAMREQLLALARPEHCAAYVPFCGDGDLAADLYRRFPVYGADLDGERIGRARKRFAEPPNHFIEADCDGFPFRSWRQPEFGIADFDSYSYPYASFRAFWQHGHKADRLVLFFTDGERQGMMRAGRWRWPTGEAPEEVNLWDRRVMFNSYLEAYVWPWFDDYIAPWRVLHRYRYLRGWMVYWGAILERP